MASFKYQALHWNDNLEYDFTEKADMQNGLRADPSGRYANGNPGFKSIACVGDRRPLFGLQRPSGCLQYIGFGVHAEQTTSSDTIHRAHSGVRKGV